MDQQPHQPTFALPKGTDLSTNESARLIEVAARLNGHPRESLGWDTPAEALAKLIPQHQTNGAAPTD